MKIINESFAFLTIHNALCFALVAVHPFHFQEGNIKAQIMSFINSKKQQQKSARRRGIAARPFHNGSNQTTRILFTIPLRMVPGVAIT